MTDQTAPGSGLDALLDAAKSLAPNISARSGEIETARRLPADLAADLAAAGFFRMVTPASLGGLQLPPADIVRAVGALSELNASIGWCTMIGATTALNAAYMDHDTAAEIYADPMAITGGVFAPMGKAVPENDGYRVTGRWQWASGSANCTWLCGGAVIIEDGEMLRLPSGAPDARMMVFPANEAELHDTWQVAGLKGTGSGDISVDGIFVPKARSVSLVTDTPVATGALYAFPAFGLLALGVCAVAMGNARGAIEDIKALARAKKSQGSSKTLSEKQSTQIEISKLEASHRSARAYLFDEIDKTWQVAQDTGEIPLARRADLRLACTHMTRTSADIARIAYDIGGGAALFLDNSLQRRFRDAHAMTQHVATAPATYEQTGRIILGLDTFGGMI
ncbi:MAG: acyl-CoA dehydrogenase family protein [Hyphomonadaceae bacterium]